MDVQTIIPLGPGHEDIVQEAIDSSPFECLVVDDTEGHFGRSHARNCGVQEAEAEWLFFLDADDVFHKDYKKAFKYFKDYDAVYGLINDGQIRIPQVRSLTFKDLLDKDPYQTLQMGHFVRREIALRHPFNENMNCGEDFDYHIRLWRHHDCIKIPYSLFVNRRGHHSTGPKSADGEDWRIAVVSLQAAWRSSQPTPTTKPSGQAV